MFNIDETIKFYELNDKSITKNEAFCILNKEEIDERDYISLINCDDLDVLEIAAKRAKKITEMYFGKNIFLYVPLYVSNICSSGCIYCGFSCSNSIERRRLKEDEIDREMKYLKNRGFNSILILTGEDYSKAGFEHLKKAVNIARGYFNEVFIESAAYTYEKYKELALEGMNGLTLYQETYDKGIYSAVHPVGKKRDFDFRLNAVEEAIRAGIKYINIGCLLGLSVNYKKDVFFLLMHVKYLMEKYPNIEISISFPRICPFEGIKFCYTKVSDLDFVKFIVYTRIFLKNVGINISTRENKNLRDNLIGLGVTKMSAESKTSVGGYLSTHNLKGQFEVSDDRKLEEIINKIKEKGYNPEFNNWVML
ncbi:MAG: 2-iminoacetate synthase ThiH [Caloramator sp.]|nr:2-iminoacetate synthase ThiH [Caloramator sp.]